jgi:hypothetical protein
MRLSRCVLLSLLAFLATAAPAAAAPVLQLDHGKTRVVEDPFLPPVSETDTPVPPPRQRPALARVARGGPSVLGQLQAYRAAGRLDERRYTEYVASYREAKRMRGKLSGTRRTELNSVIGTLDAIASRRMLTLGRLAPLFLTLDRNVEWWSTGKLLRYPDRVTFKGSRLIFQYYPGQGIQLQMLGNFGRVNGLFNGKYELNAWQMLEELLPLAVTRGGAPTWEYYFWFGGGRPPWVSAMAQGAALQAFARVGAFFQETPYLQAAERGLKLFELPPPLGVRVATPRGAHYLIYSYAPRMFVLNAFIESLVGLYDVAKLTGSAKAKALFDAGDRHARFEVRQHDTGAWSLYDLHTESDLHYHGVLQDFLQDLCDRTKTAIYCTTAARFKRDLKTPPRFVLRTTALRARASNQIRFRLSKKSRVGIVVKRGSRVLLSTSGTYAYGERSIGFRAPAAGRVTVTLTGTDLAGNRGRLVKTVTVR